MTCPKCGRPLDVIGKPHCPDRTVHCGWVNCCGKTIAPR